VGVRLAIDVGSVRIGLARCDSEGRLASPLTMVPRGRGDLDAISAQATADSAIEILVGLPVGLSGREGRQGIRRPAGRPGRAGPGPARRRALHHGHRA
jgi:putative holliday junction resolvase